VANKSKQMDLPGVEEPKIEELHSAALLYAADRDFRMEASKKEKSSKDNLLDLMKKFEKQTYNCEGVEIERVFEKEKIKVKVHKADGGDDPEEPGEGDPDE
jgi:hypothetical protein